MEKYHFNIRLDNVRYKHAGSKAVEDCRQILLNNGFIDLEISFLKKRRLLPFNLLRLVCLMFYYRIKIQPGSLVLIQYPLLGINNYMGRFIRALQRKSCKVACIIHDIDAIRSPDNAERIKKEIKILCRYDGVIAHNPAMSAWLKNNGYTGKIVEIILFDYLVNKKNITTNNNNGTDVVFAGNLGRSVFLRDLKQISSISFGIYGPGFASETIKDGQNVRWKGVFSPDEIVNVIEGRFGLIWDGPSIDSCTGLMGEYLKYNTPHKISLYLTSGLPVIVPCTAAMAAYVKANHLGLCVNSLMELPQQLVSTSEESYSEMRANALKQRALLTEGYFLTIAVQRLEHVLYTG